MKKELHQYLQTQHMMTLATMGEHVWVAPLYFVIDNDFNFYFLSNPQTKHCQAITQDSKVALAIYDSHQPNELKAKNGVQVLGKATPVSAWERARVYLQMWNEHNPGWAQLLTVENMKKNLIGSRVYKIEPIKIQWFNPEKFGGEEYETINF